MATLRQFKVTGGVVVGSNSVITAAGKIEPGAISTLTTDSLGEGSTNKYFTNTVARAAISVPGSDTSGITYNSSTGEITLPDLDGGTY
jgi:hypothetical protein